MNDVLIENFKHFPKKEPRKPRKPIAGMLDNGKITARRRRLQSATLHLDPHGWRRFKDGPITARIEALQFSLALRLKPPDWIKR